MWIGTFGPVFFLYASVKKDFMAPILQQSGEARDIFPATASGSRYLGKESNQASKFVTFAALTGLFCEMTSVLGESAKFTNHVLTPISETEYSITKGGSSL